MHGIKSAKYVFAKPSGGYPPDTLVIVTRFNDTKETRRANDDVEGGGMLAYLREGGVIEPFGSEDPSPSPKPVPQSIKPLQARNGLREWGIGREQISAFLGSIMDPLEREKAEDAWEYASEIERNNPLVAECAAYLHKTEEELDQFFRDAALT